MAESSAGDLAIAESQPLLKQDNVFLEDLCFHAQQAAEKALKALMLHLKVEVIYTHDLMALMHKIEKGGLTIPETIKEAQIITEFSVASRYPGFQDPVDEEEYREAMGMANRVVDWVADQLQTR